MKNILRKISIYIILTVLISPVFSQSFTLHDLDTINVTIEGKKQGFSSPDASWFMNDSSSFVRHRLIANGAHMWKSLDKRTILRLIEEHFSGNENRRLLIWSLLSFDSLQRSE